MTQPDHPRADLDKALARLAFWRAKGDTGHAFGWAYLTQTQAWTPQVRKTMAAELG